MKQTDETFDWIDIGEHERAANIPTGVIVLCGPQSAPCFVPGLMVTKPEKRRADAWASLTAENFGKLVPISQAPPSP